MRRPRPPRAALAAPDCGPRCNPLAAAAPSCAGLAQLQPGGRRPPGPHAPAEAQRDAVQRQLRLPKPLGRQPLGGLRLPAIARQVRGPCRSCARQARCPARSIAAPVLPPAPAPAHPTRSPRLQLPRPPAARPRRQVGRRLRCALRPRRPANPHLPASPATHHPHPDLTRPVPPPPPSLPPSLQRDWASGTRR